MVTGMKADALWLALEDEALIDRRRDPALSTILRRVIEQTMVDYAERVKIELTQGHGTKAQVAKQVSSLERTSAQLLAMLDEAVPATQVHIGYSIQEAARCAVAQLHTRVVCAEFCVSSEERRGRRRNVVVRETIKDLTLWFEFFTGSSREPYDPSEYAEARWNFVEKSFRVCNQVMPTKLKAFVMALRRPSHDMWWHLANQQSRWEERELNR